MDFRAGLRDPCTRDVARLSESVEKHEPQASVFLRFPKIHSVMVLYNNYSETTENFIVIRGLIIQFLQLSRLIIKATTLSV